MSDIAIIYDFNAPLEEKLKSLVEYSSESTLPDYLRLIDTALFYSAKKPNRRIIKIINKILNTTEEKDKTPERLNELIRKIIEKKQEFIEKKEII